MTKQIMKYDDRYNEGSQFFLFYKNIVRFLRALSLQIFVFSQFVHLLLFRIWTKESAQKLGLLQTHSSGIFK